MDAPYPGRVLVVRAAEDAARTSRLLARLGCAALAAPVIETRALDEPAPSGPFDALIVTSAKAAPRLASLPEGTRGLPVFAVGPRTARALGAAGRRDVFASGGDAQALLRDIARLAPPPARLLHVAGRDRKPEPASSLAATGYDVSVWTAYEARAAERLPDDARAGLESGAVRAVLHYSPRSARILLRLVAEAGLAQAFAELAHVAISPDVAAILREAGIARVHAAPAPNEKAMIRVLFSVSEETDEGAGRHSRRGGAKVDRVRNEAMSPRADRTGAPSTGSNRQDDVTKTPTRKPATGGDAAKDDAKKAPAAAPQAGPTPAGKPATPPAKAAQPMGATPPGAAKPAEPAVAAAVEAKPSGSKPSDAKSSDAKSSDAKPLDPKPVEAKAAPAAPTPPPSPAAPRLRAPAATSAPVSAPSAAPAARGGTIGLVAAALVGGLIAGGAVIAYDRATQSAPAPAAATLPAGLDARIAALETETRAASQAAQAAQSTAEEAQAAAQGAAERPLPVIPEEAIAASARAGETNAQAIDELRGSLGTLDTRLASLDEALSALSVDPAAEARAATIRLAAADHVALALATGRPYAQALETLSANGAPAGRIAALEPFAAGGAPSDARLAADLEAALASAPGSGAPAGPAAPDLGGGFLQRLAERAITVEAVEPEAAPAPSADFAPALRALRAGDHAGALAALSAAPEGARQAAAASIAAIEARLAAEEAARAIADEALVALAAGR